MRIEWSVAGPEGVVDVVVDTPAGTTAGQLVPDLAAAVVDGVGRARHRLALSVYGVLVPDEAMVGYPPLLHGAAVRLTDRPDRLSLNDSHTTVPAPAHELEVAVVGGPDCGARTPLTPAGVVVGRAPGADLPVDDDALSREHCRIRMTSAGPVVQDLGSTNGTYVDGARADTPTTLTTASVVRVGSTRLRLVPARARPGTTREVGDGYLEVNRRPRVATDPPTVRIRLPERPREPHRPRIPWIAMLLPLPLAGVLALVIGPQMLLFGLMTPLMMGGQAISDRVGSRRRYAADLRTHEADLARTRAAADLAVDREQALRRHLHGDASATLHEVCDAGEALWERRGRDPDAMGVRIGWGTTLSRVTIGSTGVEGQDPEVPTVDDVPVALDLAAAGVVGLHGPAARVAAVARTIVGQACTQLAPGELTLWTLGAAPTDWARLPHLGHDRAAPAASVVAEIARRLHPPDRAGARENPAARHLLVLGEPRTWREVPGLVDLLARDDHRGLVVLALAGDRAALPVECAVVMDLTGEDAVVSGSAPEPPTSLVADGTGPWWTERLSRRLAPLRDPTPTTRTLLPARVRLLDVLGHDDLDAETVRVGWARRAGPVLTLGRGHDGPHTLDLRTEGPHVLVGGTTGSGKSELLRTLVTSLALARPPDRLGFVLVDYKGGAAFGACAALPHVQAVVTDLDGHLAERALTSLGAEVRRRETLLGRAGVPDLDAYEHLPGTEPLARLVLVVDEFRVLAEELPAFVDGMVRIAAVGRSLGIHLVLATQRPAGVVTPDIRANLNLRIALRVRDRADSEDVLEAPDATWLDPASPGRALSRSGGGDLAPFQTAWVSSPAPTVRPGPRVWRVGEPEPAVTGEGATDLDRVVAATTQAAERAGLAAPPRPWLPPLPHPLPAAGTAEGDRGGDAVDLGLVDLPAEQAQVPWTWDPVADGNLAVAGGPRSGRTTTLLAVAGALARSARPVHLHALEGVPGSLAALTSVPQVGTVVGRDEPGRLARFLDRLEGEVRRRRVGADAVAGQPDPPLILLADDWDALAAEDPYPAGVPVADRITGLVRDGAPVGVRVVVAGGRTLLVGRLGSVASERLVLALPDPTDLALAGLPRGAAPRVWPPGRAVRAGDGAEVQVRLPGPLPRRRDHGDLRGTTPGAPIRVVALPRHVGAASLPWGDALWLGLGGDEAAPVAWDPWRDGPRVLVAGPLRSGRSGVLARFSASALASGRPVATVTAHRGPPTEPPGAQSISDVAQLDRWRGDPRAVVLVDDVDALRDSPLDQALVDWSQHLGPEQLLVVSGTTDDLSVRFRGLGAEAARWRTGLLLTPRTAADGALFGIRAPRVEPCAGRGVLVTPGGVTELQVGLPP